MHSANTRINYFFLSWLFVLIVTCLAILLFAKSLENEVFTEIRYSFQNTAINIKNETENGYEDFITDVNFLYSSPALNGFIRASRFDGSVPLSQNTLQQEQHHLEQLLAVYLKNNANYEQLRVVLAQGDAMELIKVERRNGTVNVLPPHQLQSKKESDYIKASQQLVQNEFFTAPISLNREFNKLDFPYRPMIRIVAPIFDNNGELQAFFIANINATPLFNKLKRLVNTPFELIITDSDGYFYISPDADEEFSKDLMPEYNWSNRYLKMKSVTNEIFVVHAVGRGESFYSFEKKIDVNLTSSDADMMVRLNIPQAKVDEIITNRQIKVYSLVSFIFVFFTVLLIYFYNLSRKKELLAKEKSLSAAIINASPNIIISTTATGIITSFNKAAEKSFDFAFQYVVGKSIDEVVPFSNKGFLKQIAILVEQGYPHKFDFQLTESEQILYFEVIFSAVFSKTGLLEGVAIILRDVTQQSLSEQKIKELNADLEFKVLKRTQQLEKANNVKNAFISNISHEMRTPLNGIMGTLNILRQEALSENQLNCLDMTQVSVEALSLLVNDILDISKIEAGKLELYIKPFNPIKLLETLASTHAIRAQEKGLEFILNISELQCSSLVTDPHRISQVITHFISNAIKFTDSGYIKIIARTEELDNDFIRLHVEVQDSGKGIDKNNQHTLFDLFTQEDNTISSKYGGTGLGLAISKQLILLLGGEVGFESDQGVGSRFYFDLPILRDNCQFIPHQERLKEKSFVVLSSSNELRISLNSLIKSFGGLCLQSAPYIEWLSSIQELSVPMPDFFLIDENALELEDLNSRWEALVTNTSVLPQVVVLKNSGSTPILRKNLSAEFLGKPILTSEFLQLFADERKNINQQNSKSLRACDNGIVQTKDVLDKLTDARILIVDDNQINIVVERSILSGLPVKIDSALNGELALEQLLRASRENKPFHCIIMDCQMPILNGYETTKKIRAGAVGDAYRKIPIIALTANVMSGEKEKCLLAGMSDFLTKPVKPEQLTDKTVKWLLSVYSNI